MKILSSFIIFRHVLLLLSQFAFFWQNFLLKNESNSKYESNGERPKKSMWQLPTCPVDFVFSVIKFFFCFCSIEFHFLNNFFVHLLLDNALERKKVTCRVIL